MSSSLSCPQPCPSQLSKTSLCPHTSSLALRASLQLEQLHTPYQGLLSPGHVSVYLSCLHLPLTMLFSAGSPWPGHLTLLYLGVFIPVMVMGGYPQRARLLKNNGRKSVYPPFAFSFLIPLPSRMPFLNPTPPPFLPAGSGWVAHSPLGLSGPCSPNSAPRTELQA